MWRVRVVFQVLCGDFWFQVIPILKTLYNAPNSSSHHIYMSLIILLIFSEDDSFNRVIHETVSRSTFA